MRKLLNTLFVTSPDTYLALDGENVVVYREEEWCGIKKVDSLFSRIS